MTITGYGTENLASMCFHFVKMGVTFEVTMTNHIDWTMTLTGGY